jgi:hydroxyacyl-ACP dehydratase HTD2-like protein with hotdog domain
MQHVAETFGRGEARFQGRQSAAELCHCEQRHIVRGAIIEAHTWLCLADRIGEGSAAWDQHEAAAARLGDGAQPAAQQRRIGVAAAQFNHQARAHTGQPFG